MKLFKLTWVAGALMSSLFISGCTSHKQAATATSGNSETKASVSATAPAEDAELSGTWNYTMTNPEEGTLTGIITIQKGANASYTGHITANEMELDNDMSISKAQLNGSNFMYEGDVITPEGNIPFAMSGTINGNAMEGENNVQYRNRSLVFKIKATRK